MVFKKQRGNRSFKSSISLNDVVRFVENEMLRLPINYDIADHYSTRFVECYASTNNYKDKRDIKTTVRKLISKNINLFSKKISAYRKITVDKAKKEEQLPKDLSMLRNKILAENNEIKRPHSNRKSYDNHGKSNEMKVSFDIKTESCKSSENNSLETSAPGLTQSIDSSYNLQNKENSTSNTRPEIGKDSFPTPNTFIYFQSSITKEDQNKPAMTIIPNAEDLNFIPNNESNSVPYADNLLDFDLGDQYWDTPVQSPSSLNNHQASTNDLSNENDLLKNSPCVKDNLASTSLKDAMIPENCDLRSEYATPSPKSIGDTDLIVYNELHAESDNMDEVQKESFNLGAIASNSSDLSEICTPVKLQNKFSMSIPFESWESYLITDKDGNRNLKRGWTQVVNRELRNHNRFCTLKFGRRKFRRITSRKIYKKLNKAVGTKQKIPYFEGEIRCQHRSCIKYSYHIKDTPQKKQNVTFNFSLIGKFKHFRCDRHRRHIAAGDRDALKEVIKKEYPSNVALDLLYKADPKVLSKGNVSDVPTPSIIANMKKEARAKYDNSTDDFIDLQKQYFMFRDDDFFNGKYVQGFIQRLQFKPFSVVFYSEKQLNYVSKILNEDKFVHFYTDATGTIAKKPYYVEKELYYYVIILKQPFSDAVGFPVAEAFTEDNTVSGICYFFDYVFQDLRKILNKKYKVASAAESDFSFGILQALCRSLNRCDIINYVNTCMNAILEDKLPETLTVQHVCNSHTIRFVLGHISKMTKCIIAQKAALIFFAKLQKCKSLNEAKDLIYNGNIVFSCEKKSPLFEIAIKSLDIVDTESKEFDEETSGDPNSLPLDEIVSDKKSQRESSLFYHYFKNIVNESNIAVDGIEEFGDPNELYIKNFMSYLLKNLLSYFPLWSGIMFQFLREYDGKDYRQTTSAVESFIRKMKYQRYGQEKYQKSGRCIRIAAEETKKILKSTEFTNLSSKVYQKKDDTISKKSKPKILNKKQITPNLKLECNSQGSSCESIKYSSVEKWQRKNVRPKIHKRYHEQSINSLFQTKETKLVDNKLPTIAEESELKEYCEPMPGKLVNVTRKLSFDEGLLGTKGSEISEEVQNDEVDKKVDFPKLCIENIDNNNTLPCSPRGNVNHADDYVVMQEKNSELKSTDCERQNSFIRNLTGELMSTEQQQDNIQKNEVDVEFERKTETCVAPIDVDLNNHDSETHKQIVPKKGLRLKRKPTYLCEYVDTSKKARITSTDILCNDYPDPYNFPPFQISFNNNIVNERLVKCLTTRKVSTKELWINSEIVYSFISIKAMETLDRGYRILLLADTISRYIVEECVCTGEICKFDFFSFDLLFIPIFNADHWMLIVVVNKSKTMIFLDSVKNSRVYRGKLYLYRVAQFLNDMQIAQNREALDFKDWNIIIANDIQDQGNQVDCGVYVCLFAYIICEGRFLQYTPKEIPHVRRYISHILSTTPSQTSEESGIMLKASSRKRSTWQKSTGNRNILINFNENIKYANDGTILFLSQILENLFSATRTHCCLRELCQQPKGEAQIYCVKCKDFVHRSCYNRKSVGELPEEYICLGCRKSTMSLT